MTLLVIALAWCALHFVAFILWLHWGHRSERSVLIFHLVSFVIFCSVVLLAVVASAIPFTIAVGMIAVHAMYSLSVLELWTLSEGSYAISMLASLKATPVTGTELAARFRPLGEQKRISRIEALEKSGAITINGELKLTQRGAKSARVVSLLRWLANIRDAA